MEIDQTLGSAASAGVATAVRARRTVLVVCRERQVCELLATLLRASGCFPLVASSGEEGRSLTAQVLPDLVIIDLDAEGEDLAWARELGRVRTRRPVHAFMLVSDPDRQCGPRRDACGASLCLAKPIDPHLLMQEVRRFLRGVPAPGATGAGAGSCAAGCIELDPHRPSVRLRIAGVWQTLEIPWTEHRLLACLLSEGGEAKSRQAIRDAVWPNAPADLRTVDQYVHRLRRSLRAAGAPGLVKTVIGFGYRIRPEGLGPTRPGSESWPAGAGDPS